MIEAETHIDRLRQQIFFAGQELEDGTQTIEWYKIGRESTVKVTEEPDYEEEEQKTFFGILVKTPNGSAITLENLLPSDTVLEIKWQLHNSNEIWGALEVKHMRLACKDDMELFNEHELGFYGIGDSMEIKLQKRVGEGLQSTHWYRDPDFWTSWERWNELDSWD
jgi:hypothetical protein